MEGAETVFDASRRKPKKLPRFNVTPDWLLGPLGQLLGFVESYGWFVVLGLALLSWLAPKVWDSVQHALDERTRGAKEAAELVRVGKLEERRRRQAEEQQRRLAMEGEEWAARRKAAEEEGRRRRIKELEEKERRLGIRPRGRPHFAAADSRGDDDDLYS